MLDINLRFNTEHLISDDCQPGHTDKTLVDANSKNGVDVSDVDIPLPDDDYNPMDTSDNYAADTSSDQDTGNTFSSGTTGGNTDMGSNNLY